MGILEQAGPVADRTRERAAGVAEQLRLQQILWQRRTVDIAEPALAARAELVNRPRHELLPHAALALNEDGERSRSGTGNRRPNLSNGRAGAHQLRD